MIACPLGSQGQQGTIRYELRAAVLFQERSTTPPPAASLQPFAGGDKWPRRGEINGVGLETPEKSASALVSLTEFMISVSFLRCSTVCIFDVVLCNLHMYQA